MANKDNGEKPQSSWKASGQSNQNPRKDIQCLNEECKGAHKLKDCPNTTPEKKKEIWEKIKAGKTSKSLSVLASQNDGFFATGRFRGKLADKVLVIVNGDYGADRAALSEDHVRACSEAGIFVQSLLLSTPIRVELALNASDPEKTQEYRADRKVRISTTIDTASGPLRFRNVEYLVFKESMPEVLLSRT